MPSWKQLVPLAALAAAGCGPLPTWLGGPAYRDLGVTHYAGKPLLGTSGEFEALSVSPAGDRAVFAGRESNAAYELFTATLDGPVRQLVPTGPSPRVLGWSPDGQRLVYRAWDVAPPVGAATASGTPTGEALHVVSLADGADRKLADVPGLTTAVPAPTLDVLALHGALLDVLDVGTGSRTPLDRPAGDGLYADWSPDGKRLFAFVDDGPRRSRLLRYEAPGWQPTEVAGGLPRPEQRAWMPGGDAWLTYMVSQDPADGRALRLEVGTITTAGAADPVRAWPLGAIAAGGYAASALAPLPSPDRRRMLVYRFAYASPGGLMGPDPNRPPAALLIVDVATGAVEVRERGPRPVAWLDDRRVLVSSGGPELHEQDQVLSILTL